MTPDPRLYLGPEMHQGHTPYLDFPKSAPEPWDDGDDESELLDLGTMAAMCAVFLILAFCTIGFVTLIYAIYRMVAG